MKNFGILVLLVICVLSITLTFILIEKSKKYKRVVEDRYYNISAERDNYKNYLLKLFDNEGKSLDIFPLLNLNGDTLDCINLKNNEGLIIVFPRSSCGICQEEFLFSLKKHLEKNDNLVIITDVVSKNDVMLLLQEFQMPVENLYLKINNYLPDIERKANPYLFYLERDNKEGDIISHLYIPFSKDIEIHNNYFELILNKLK